MALGRNPLEHRTDSGADWIGQNSLRSRQDWSEFLGKSRVGSFMSQQKYSEFIQKKDLF